MLLAFSRRPFHRSSWSSSFSPCCCKAQKILVRLNPGSLHQTKSISTRTISSPPGTFFKPDDDFIPDVTVSQVLESYGKDYDPGPGPGHSKRKFDKIVSDFEKYADLFPQDQTVLPPRTMRQSFGCSIIHFEGKSPLTDILGHNHEPRISPLSPSSVLGGVDGALNIRSCHRQILSFYDVFAVWISYRYLSLPMFESLPIPRNPYIMVSGFVDHVTFTPCPIQTRKPARTYGHVAREKTNYVEVMIQSDQQDPHGKWNMICHGLVKVAARTPAMKPALVNKLESEDKNESRYLNKVLDLVARREYLKKDVKNGPILTPEEGRRLQMLEHQKSLLGPDKKVSSIKDTEVQITNKVEMHHRNRYYKAFGGFLVTCAEEAAAACCKRFGKASPLLVHVGHGTFVKGVPIGAELRASAIVATTKGNFVFCPVVSDFKDPETQERCVATIFNFVFQVPSTAYLPILVPNGNREKIVYINGRRYLNFLATPKSMYPTLAI